MVLAGLMGAGKSTIGQALAERLNLTFLDADDAIQAHAGRSLPDIFRTCGESGFRQIEQQVLLSLLRERRDAVLALGGGAFAQPEIRAACRTSGIRAVWLRVAPEEALRRVLADGGAQKRPLLADADPLERLRSLLAKREGAYAEAELHVDAGGRTIADVVEEIVRGLA